MRGFGKQFIFWTAAGLLGFVARSHSSDAIQGETTRFEAPSGVVERCVRIARMPGGRYLDTDEHQEAALCAIDVHSPDTALCPKLFSTSPGTLVYDLTGGPWAGRAEAFEDARCRESAPLKDGTNGPPASLKTTMNARDTSGTFSVAPLLYYHFARYLNSALHVPPVVYRSIDREAFASRVVVSGEAASANRSALKMNHAGWRRLSAAMQDPSTYQPTDELFTRDRRQVYGAMLHYSGKRYGPEFNGTRASGWGDGQSRDFQDTAPFRALRSGKPLVEAVAEGLAEARRDATLAQAMGREITDQQIVYWMQELTEITVLDFIFSQQDRIGNIDYRSFWHWQEDGEVRRALASGPEPPPEARGRGAKLIRRTELNDNDAAGRIAYANYAKRTRMLEGIRHYHADTYRRVQWLAADFETQGEAFAYVRDSFGLTSRQLGQLVANAVQAAAILRGTCEAGEMRFDLDADAFFLAGRVEDEPVECSGW